MRSLLFLLTCSAAAFGFQDAPQRSLADAERAFSASSEKNGITASFVEFLDDSCVMFDPGPVNGKALYRRRKENGAYLVWSPTFVVAAASGDLGLSAGPWVYRRAKGDSSASYGHYFSLWKRNSSGIWKVVLDDGINYAEIEKRSEQEEITALPVQGTVKSKTSAGTIFELERAFNAASQAGGIRSAYLKYSSENIHLYRKGSFPISTKDEAIRSIGQEAKGRRYIPIDAAVSSSGDIGYSYGYSIDQKNDTSSFVRVWTNVNGWKIAADFQKEYPK